MPMHEIEDYVEAAIIEISRSVITEDEKRNLIYTLFRLEELGDCSFTNMRTLRQLVNCQYTFLFPKEKMYDYAGNRHFYEEELPHLQAFANGDVYFTGVLVNPPDMVCVDSGSEAWDKMVEAGAIHGVGARPVEELDPLYTLRRIRLLMSYMDERLVRAHLELFLFSGALERLPEEEYPVQFGMSRAQVEKMLAAD